MRAKVLQYVVLMILTMVLNINEVQAQELPVTDTENSACLSNVQGDDDEQDRLPTIILEKEGNILSMQVLNYTSNCATQYFDVSSNFTEGSEGSPCTLYVDVKPFYNGAVRCLCPFNVSFTVHDLEPNAFFLKCWWYEGLVELTEGEPLVLKDIREDATIGGFNYTLRKALRHAMVKKNDWTGEVRIPTELSYEGQTYSVTSMDVEAFRGNTAMTKVTLPRTLVNMNFDNEKGISGNPFNGCSSLESIEVEEGNPVLCVVDGVLFNKEKTILYTFPAADNRTSYTVPDGVTRIEGNAFSSNQFLVSVTLPDDVTALGSAFFGCTNLEEVRLPSHLKSLAGYSFAKCEHLKSIVIPDDVTHLGTSLFSGCSSLTTVTMPDSVTSTDYAVFEDCTSLKNVTLSPNLNAINQKMFLNCSSLTEIQIPENVVSVLSDAFKNCMSLKTLDIPESVNRLGNSVFSGCKFDSLLIRGIVESRWVTERVFDGLNTLTKLYVQPSEVEKYNRVYRGPVYPMPDETNGISDIISPTDNSSDLFDLQGRRVIGNPNRGIYISDGRKRVVK